MKNIRIFYLKIFLFLVVKISIYLNRHVFVMYFLGNIVNLSAVEFVQGVLKINLSLE